MWCILGNKYGMKHRLSLAAYKQTSLNKRAVAIKKSFDEVNKILNSSNTKWQQSWFKEDLRWKIFLMTKHLKKK